jgi:hypothetical protein
MGAPRTGKGRVVFVVRCRIAETADEVGMESRERTGLLGRRATTVVTTRRR